MTIPADVEAIMEETFAQDRALYAAAGLLPVECDGCGESREPDHPHWCRDAYDRVFCSPACRSSFKRRRLGLR